MKAMKMVYKQNKKSKHRGVGVKELLKWRAIQQKEKIQIEGDFTDPEPDYEESKALDSTIGYVKLLSVVDNQLVPKVGITFKILEDAAKFYKDYAKAACFSTRVRSTNKKENEIKNQLITCSRGENGNLKYLRPRRQIPQLV
ncbi:uncharacterized protein [Arachis hypogaea]|uniref:uncharacterized protein isoform X3 n=1 Tax=Arachis hypogaea TaxID=3818 RepID=UPI003B21DC09